MLWPSHNILTLTEKVLEVGAEGFGGWSQKSNDFVKKLEEQKILGKDNKLPPIDRKRKRPKNVNVNYGKNQKQGFTQNSPDKEKNTFLDDFSDQKSMNTLTRSKISQNKDFSSNLDKVSSISNSKTKNSKKTNVDQY